MREMIQWTDMSKCVCAQLSLPSVHSKCLDRDRTVLMANAYELEKKEGRVYARRHLVRALWLLLMVVTNAFSKLAL